MDELTPLVYEELHERARNYLRHERPDHTLQPTALIHETYLRPLGERSHHEQCAASLSTMHAAVERGREEVIRRFLGMQQDVCQRLEAAQTIEAGSVKVQSPFAARVRYPLGSPFDLALAHERRHLWQAWQIRRLVENVE